MINKKSIFPLVSIIIPIYNAEKHLDTCLTSCINQTYNNYEIILINDGSQDNSLSIAQKYSNIYSNIKIISILNSGAAHARNIGLEIAKGDYIQYLDADDYISKNKIEKQLQDLIELKDFVGIVDTVYFKDGYEPNIETHKTSNFIYSTVNTFDFLINLYGGNPPYIGSMFSPASYLIPRKIIEKAGAWNEYLTSDDDGEYMCRVLLQANGIQETKNTFVFYRKFENYGSLSALNTKEKYFNCIYASLLKRQHLLAFKYDERINIAIARQIMGLGVNAYPKYKDVSKYAIELIKKDLGGHFIIPIIGGKKLEWAKRIFGWKVAKQLSYIYHNIIK